MSSEEALAVRKYEKKHEHYHEEKAGNMPLIEGMVLAIYRLMDGGGDELFWLVALRRIIVELERRKPGTPKRAPGVKDLEPYRQSDWRRES